MHEKQLVEYAKLILAINLVIETEIKGPGVYEIIKKANEINTPLSKFFFKSVRHGQRVPKADTLYILSHLLDIDVRQMFIPRDTKKADKFLSLSPTEQRIVARILESQGDISRLGKKIPFRIYLRKSGISVSKNT